MTTGRHWTHVIPIALSCCALAACGTVHRSGISPEQRLHVAKAAETSGDIILARAMYAAAAEEAGADRPVRITAAEGLARLGSPADAMMVLSDVVTQAPGDDDARRVLGSLQIANGMPAEGVKNLAKVIADRPLDDVARLNEGVALDIMRRHGEAQTLYRAILSRNPSDQDAANNLAYSLMRSGQPEEAKAVVAPFLGRGDLSERMAATIKLVMATSGARPTPLSTAVRPTTSAPAASSTQGHRKKPGGPTARRATPANVRPSGAAAAQPQ